MLSRLRKHWRLITILTTGLLLVGAVLAVREYWLYRPMGEGPAGPPVPAEAFKRVWTDRKVLLLGVGDSVTAGLGSTSGRSYRATGTPRTSKTRTTGATTRYAGCSCWR